MGLGCVVFFPWVLLTHLNPRCGYYCFYLSLGSCCRTLGRRPTLVPRFMCSMSLTEISKPVLLCVRMKKSFQLFSQVEPVAFWGVDETALNSLSALLDCGLEPGSSPSRVSVLRGRLEILPRNWETFPSKSFSPHCMLSKEKFQFNLQEFFWGKNVLSSYVQPGPGS